MAIMGVRASAQEIRYAILEKDTNGGIIFSNHVTENKLKYPANMDSVSEKLSWVKSEIDRILRQNPNIQKIILKMNEYGAETAAKRETTYVDSILLFCAAEHGVSIERKLNSQISSTAAKAKELAERRVGKTEQYWNNTMADAILALKREVLETMPLEDSLLTILLDGQPICMISGGGSVRYRTEDMIAETLEQALQKATDTAETVSELAPHGNCPYSKGRRARRELPAPCRL